MAVVKRVLGPEQIVSEALRIIDGDGLEALSMRRLGEALGVEAMSLYHHFANKTALLDAIVERVLGELHFPPPSNGSWQEQFRRAARGFRAVLLRHPNVMPLIARQQLTSPGTLQAVGSAMALLRNAGFDAETALRVFCVADAFILGHVFWEIGSEPFRSGQAQRLAPPPGADPYLALLAPRIGELSCDETFEFGLDLIEHGLERVIAERP